MLVSSWSSLFAKVLALGFTECKGLTGTLANTEDVDALEKSWLKFKIKPQMFVRCSIMYKRAALCSQNLRKES